MGRSVPRIAIVGTSGAGKTTLANRLRQLGFDAYTVAQEHSLVPKLWARRNPDLLIYLEASYETVARRREISRAWDWLRLEKERLADARRHADLTLKTDDLTPQAVAVRVMVLVEQRYGS